MNANTVINMVIRMVMRRVVNGGINAGMDALGKRRGPSAQDGPAQDGAQAQDGRNTRANRPPGHDTRHLSERVARATRLGRRTGRF